MHDRNSTHIEIGVVFDEKTNKRERVREAQSLDDVSQFSIDTDYHALSDSDFVDWTPLSLAERRGGGGAEVDGRERQAQA